MAQPRTSTSSRSNRDDVLQFLDSLDAYSGTPPKPSSSSAAGPGGAGSLPRSTSSNTVGGKPALSSTSAANSPAKPAGSAAPSGAAAVPGAAGGAKPANAAEAQSVLDFLDEITQRSSTPTARTSLGGAERGLEKKTSVPSGLSRSTSRTNLGAVPVRSSAAAGGVAGEAPRRSTESARSVRSTTPAAGVSPKPAAPSAPSASSSSSAAPAPAAEAPAGAGGWGWSSMWTQASSVVQTASNLAAQAKTAAEEQVKAAQSSAAAGGGIAGLGGGLMKALGENEQAKKWSETVQSYAKGAHLDQLGKDLKSSTLKSLTDLLNAVAPPIAEHEVIQVSLSHDMVGYDGVETLVYRGLAKIMEQIEGGTLIVNKGTEEKPREQAEGDEDFRDLNVVDGLTEGWKLAEASLDQLIKATYAPPAPPSESSTSDLTVPVTTCPIYLRIQPALAPLPFLPSSSLNPASTTPDSQKALFFLLLLRDPTHKLVHSSVSQSMPASWLEIPFEENEWVEDAMVEIIRRSVEIIGQEYIQHRMRAQSNAISQAREEAKKALEQHHSSSQSQQQLTDEQRERQEQQEAEASQAAQEARVGVV
ncbi:hypothetical protein JCM6882_007210 [Rhodosporidiobolus microsporus]